MVGCDYQSTFFPLSVTLVSSHTHTHTHISIQFHWWMLVLLCLGWFELLSYAEIYIFQCAFTQSHQKSETHWFLQYCFKIPWIHLQLFNHGCAAEKTTTNHSTTAKTNNIQGRHGYKLRRTIVECTTTSQQLNPG